MRICKLKQLKNVILLCFLNHLCLSLSLSLFSSSPLCLLPPALPFFILQASTQSQKCKAPVLIPALWLLIGGLQMGKSQEPVLSGQKSTKSPGLLGVLFSCTSLSISLLS